MQIAVIGSLERDLQVAGVTGVEDRLQKDVSSSLEMLQTAGLRIWVNVPCVCSFLCSPSAVVGMVYGAAMRDAAP